jgi:HlyD family secretion protein
MLERFKAMSADEQKQFVARLKERGADTSAFETALKAAPKKPAATASTPQGAETIDALFAPLPPVESRGRVWLYTSDKQLKAINVRLGITDGTNTELLSGEVQPGMELVTSVLTGATRPAVGGNQQNGNPLLPGNNRGNFQGGGRGRGF